MSSPATRKTDLVQQVRDVGVDYIEEKLISQLAEKFGTQPELSDGLSYIGADSVGMAELTVEMEKEYGITFADDIFSVETVQELADYIRDRQKSSASG